MGFAHNRGARTVGAWVPPAFTGPDASMFDIRKSRAILFGPSPYSGVSPGGDAGNGLH
jgi:hypothetical protein